MLLEFAPRPDFNQVGSLMDNLFERSHGIRHAAYPLSGSATSKNMLTVRLI